MSEISSMKRVELKYGLSHTYQFWHVGRVSPVNGTPIDAQGGSISDRAAVNTSEVPLLSYRTTGLIGWLRFCRIERTFGDANG